MTKISVIIPVYNVEKYLKQCLDSVINQTYKNLEIICVNDASTDNSPEILKEYAQKDIRIIIVNNEKNFGLGLTRNHGMEYATGEYIHFLDSDDWMEIDAYEKLARIIEKDNSIDLIYFYWKEFSNKNKNIIATSQQKTDIFNKIIKIDNNFRCNMEWSEQVWNKLYSKKFLETFNIIFNDYRCHEDMEYSLKIRIHARSIYYLNEYLLNYRIDNPNSLMGNKVKYSNCVFQSYLNAEKWCTKLDKQVCNTLLSYEFMQLYNHAISSYQSIPAIYNELQNNFKKINYSLLEGIIWRVHLLDCKEIATLPEWLYKTKKLVRNFTRTNMPSLHKFIVKIKNY